MDVLEALDNETLQSHSRGPGFESLCAHSNEPDRLIFVFRDLQVRVPSKPQKTGDFA